MSYQKDGRKSYGNSEEAEYRKILDCGRRLLSDAYWRALGEYKELDK